MVLSKKLITKQQLRDLVKEADWLIEQYYDVENHCEECHFNWRTPCEWHERYHDFKLKFKDVK